MALIKLQTYKCDRIVPLEAKHKPLPSFLKDSSAAKWPAASRLFACSEDRHKHQ